MIHHGTVKVPLWAKPEDAPKYCHQYADIYLEAAAVAEARGNYLLAAEQFERALAAERRYSRPWASNFERELLEPVLFRLERFLKQEGVIC